MRCCHFNAVFLAKIYNINQKMSESESQELSIQIENREEPSEGIFEIHIRESLQFFEEILFRNQYGPHSLNRQQIIEEHHSQSLSPEKQTEKKGIGDSKDIKNTPKNKKTKRSFQSSSSTLSKKSLNRDGAKNVAQKVSSKTHTFLKQAKNKYGHSCSFNRFHSYRQTVCGKTCQLLIIFTRVFFIAENAPKDLMKDFQIEMLDYLSSYLQRQQEKVDIDNQNYNEQPLFRKLNATIEIFDECFKNIESNELDLGCLYRICSNYKIFDKKQRNGLEKCFETLIPAYKEAQLRSRMRFNKGAKEAKAVDSHEDSNKESTGKMEVPE